MKPLSVSFFSLGLLAAPIGQATDLTLLGGYQYNADFEIAEDAALQGNAGDDIALDGGAALGLALDFEFYGNPDQRVGLHLSRAQGSFESDSGLADTDMDITHLHFTGMSYYPTGRWENFVLAGVGATHFDPADAALDSDTRFSLQIGGGTNYRLSERLLLRLDARWFLSFFSDSAAVFCSGGCIIAVKSETYSQVQVNAGLMWRF